MIGSLLDTDLYKFTMQEAVRRLYPGIPVEYRLFPRSTPLPWNDTYVGLVRENLEGMGGLGVTKAELEWLRGLEIFDNAYLGWLKDFRSDPDQVRLARSPDNNLEVTIRGPWEETILWEVPLLAILSQSFYETVHRDWAANLLDYYHQSQAKAIKLSQAGCPFSDFGTRRRRNHALQETAVQAFAESGSGSTFVGTSNVSMARRYRCKPVGTVAHEWIMGVAGLVGVKEANGTACRKWLEVHGSITPLIALTDTYTLDNFLENFKDGLPEKYDGVRHDSGDPIDFADRMERFYLEAGIDPSTKTLVFSDGLDVPKAAKIQEYVNGRMKTAYGIGTHLTNDVDDKSLDIVIKLTAVNNKAVAKITEDPGKATGPESAVAEAMKALGLDPAKSE